MTIKRKTRRFWQGLRGNAAHGFLITSLFIVLCMSPAYADPPGRIISLVPSVTEMLYALGVEDRLVGVTTFCDYPPEAKAKPKVGGMSNPSLEAVAALRPDLVVMTESGNPKEFYLRLRSLGIKTHVMRAGRVGELPSALRGLGSAVGASGRAEELAAAAEKSLGAYLEAKPFEGKALFVVWPEPLLVAGSGTVINDALDILGLKNIASEAKGMYPKYSVEEALRQSPEYIFIGKGHERMRELSERLIRKLEKTPAVKNGKVFFLSDSLYRFGPRILDGIEEMAEKLRGEGKGKAPDGE